MTIYDEALAITPEGDRQWRAIADPRCEANTGMFGGWTAAVLLKAVLADAGGHGTPVAVTINFVGRISPGDNATIRTTHLGGGRSINTWRADLCNADSGEVRATASVVMAKRRDSDAFTEPGMPAAAPPDGLESFSPPGTFGQTVEFRAVAGFPPVNQPNTKSLHWIREATGRPHDFVQLAYLADCYPPRIFYISEAYRPSSTLAMSVYFYATEPELAGVGGDFILSEVTGTRAVGATAGSQLRFWSRDGALLATSEQMCSFR